MIRKNSSSAEHRLRRANDARPDTGDTLTLTDGRQAASIALLGNYIAGSFVTAPVATAARWSPKHRKRRSRC